MTEPLLSITDLSAVSDRENGASILRDVGLTLERGEVRGLVGERGAGKSTIAKALLGILPRTVRVTSGAIRFEGKNLLTIPQRELRDIMGSEISLIPQDPQTALNPGRRIEAQLTDGLRMRRSLSVREAHVRALKLLEEVHIRDPERVLRAYPHELSGGMRQRVMIAMALACEPRLLIADEPTTALDVTIQAQILDLMRELKSRLGSAIVLITHDLGVVAEMAQRVVVMYAGRKVEEAPVAELFARPRHPYTRGLLDSMPKLGRRAHQLVEIPGTVPSLIGEAAGCAFAARCAFASQRCREELPPFEADSAGHGVACWHSERVIRAVA